MKQLDVNVLDILLDRKPHVAGSGAVWKAIEQGRAKGLLPAHGVRTICCLIRRERGARAAR